MTPTGPYVLIESARGHLIGEPAARMWQLYLAGEALAFDQRRIGVDQILVSLPEPGDCKDGEQAAQWPEHPGVDPSTPEPKDDSDRTGQNQTKIGCTDIGSSECWAIVAADHCV